MLTEYWKIEHEQGSADASTSGCWGIRAGYCWMSSTGGRFGEGIDGCVACSSTSATIRHSRLLFASSTHSLFTPLALRIAVCRIGSKQSEGSSVLGSTHGPHRLA